VSIQAIIPALKTLEVVDTRIVQLQTELEGERVHMDEESERHVALVTKIANVEGLVEAMEKTRGEVHGEVRQLNLQLDKAREKMARCRNEKEANAAQRELEELRRLFRDREFEIQKLGALLEEAGADLAKVESERAEIASQIDGTQGVAAAKVRELEQSLAEQNKKRTAALSGISTSMQRRYDVVCKRRGTGTAAVVKGSCTACHISLSPMLYQEIMRLTEFYQCPSCMRFLYYETPVVGGSTTSEPEDEDEDTSS
jgi:predicted  nucleic acid-binding Zn-ribbon protein